MSMTYGIGTGTKMWGIKPVYGDNHIFFFLQKHPFPQLIYNYIRTLFTAIHHITEL